MNGAVLLLAYTETFVGILVLELSGSDIWDSPLEGSIAPSSLLKNCLAKMETL